MTQGVALERFSIGRFYHVMRLLPYGRYVPAETYA